MTQATQSQIPFLVLVIFTFVTAAMGITFTITLNWLFLGGVVVAGAVVAWSARKVLA